MRGRPAPGAEPPAAGARSFAVRSPSVVSIGGPTAGGSKRERQGAIRDIVGPAGIASQQELVDRLNERGFAVTQATVSRDLGELGLVKAHRGGGSVYVFPESLRTTDAAAEPPAATDERLRRILADVPVTVGRSGLILLVTGSPGTASIIAQAIDESSLTEQEGTLAGDNTLLVLFGDEDRLLAWRRRFEAIVAAATTARP